MVQKIPIDSVFSKLTYVKTHRTATQLILPMLYKQCHCHHQNYTHILTHCLPLCFCFFQACCETSHPVCYEYKCKMGARSISELSETAPTPTHPNLIFTFHCIWICLLASLLSTTAGEHNMLQRLLCSDGINMSGFNLYSLNDIS